MSIESFNIAWNELREFQKEAAQWGDGPVLVLAGPGSGKTRVLTCRIANILNSTKDQNFRILGLTFTNKAADEMRSRVVSYVDGQEKRIFLGTFHSFCADLLRQHGTHIGINPNFQIYSQPNDLKAVLNSAVEKAKSISEIITDLDYKVLPIIQRLKSNLVFPEQVSKVIKEPKMAERISIVYPQYEEELSKRNALDFDSLIMRAYQLLTQYPALAKRYKIVYKYICVDEFQDTNQAQYSFLQALTGSDFKNLFVVADDDQIIYQWNGASHQRIEQLVKEYNPTIIQLPVNYRCPPEVIGLANNLIRYNFFRTKEKKPLEAFKTSDSSNVVRLLPAFENSVAEAQGIAADIQKMRIDSSNESIVVLARNRKLLEEIEKSLVKNGLPAVIAQRKDEFESTPFVWLHSVLRLANDRLNQEDLEAVNGAFYQLTGVEIDLSEVIAQAGASNNDYLQHWIQHVLTTSINGISQTLVDSMQKSIGEGRNYLRFSQEAIAWFDELVKLQQVDNSEEDEEIYAHYEDEKNVWNQLVLEITRSIGKDLGLGAFLQELQMRSKEPSPKQDDILLMTIHGSKGKEFEHVYIVGLVEDELPSYQSRKKGDNSLEIEEERRNCFVAITRTIKTLTLSYAKTYRGWRKNPSRFLYEMGILQ